MKAVEEGVAISKLRPNVAQPNHPCLDCGRMFASRAAVGAHMAKEHNKASRVNSAVCGTVCQVCLVDFHATHRLQDHVRRVSKCRAAYLANDTVHSAKQRRQTQQGLAACCSSARSQNVLGYPHTWGG